MCLGKVCVRCGCVAAALRLRCGCVLKQNFELVGDQSEAKVRLFGSVSEIRRGFGTVALRTPEKLHFFLRCGLAILPSPHLRCETALRFFFLRCGGSGLFI